MWYRLSQQRIRKTSLHPWIKTTGCVWIPRHEIIPKCEYTDTEREEEVDDERNKLLVQDKIPGAKEEFENDIFSLFFCPNPSLFPFTKSFPRRLTVGVIEGTCFSTESPVCFLGKIRVSHEIYTRDEGSGRLPAAADNLIERTKETSCLSWDHH